MQTIKLFKMDGLLYSQKGGAYILYALKCAFNLVTDI